MLQPSYRWFNLKIKYYNRSDTMIRITLDEILAIKGKTKYWLAKETDINYQTLLLLQQNKTISIRFETLEKICIALNCTTNDIIKVEVEK